CIQFGSLLQIAIHINTACIAGHNTVVPVSKRKRNAALIIGSDLNAHRSAATTHHLPASACEVHVFLHSKSLPVHVVGQSQERDLVSFSETVDTRFALKTFF